MWGVSIISALLLFSLISLSQGLSIREASNDSWDDEVEPSLPSNKRPEPVAWLEGLHVRAGEMSPVFNSTTLNYNVTLSPDVTDIQIIAQVSLGTDQEKYKVKTKSRILQPDNVNFPSRLNGNTSVTLVEVHVSASDHQSVTYYLEVGHDSLVLHMSICAHCGSTSLALQGRSNVWSILLQVLFWTGVVVAVVVLGIFGYAFYLALSRGGVTGQGLHGHASSGVVADYEAVQDPERTGSSRR